jgi:hypothetical protein
MPLYYISFVNENFLGATVVEAQSQTHALQVAIAKGLEPEGVKEALVIFIPPNHDDPHIKTYLNRLVGEEELRRTGGKQLKELM